MALRRCSEQRRGARSLGPLGEEGQSTIEFALTILLLMAFILFYVQLCLIFAWGNYVHYATFMSARAYLAAGPDREDQEERARNVLIRMVKRSLGEAGRDRFPGIAKGVGGSEIAGVQIGPGSQFKDGDANLSWLQGVRYKFRSKLFLMPLAGRGAPEKPSVNQLTLQSESWLGREPAYNECQEEMGSRDWVFDNGC